MNEKLFHDGLVSNLVLQNSRGKAGEYSKRLDIERQRLAMSGDSIQAEIAAQKTQVETVQELAAVRRDQSAALRVRAGIRGVLQ